MKHIVLSEFYDTALLIKTTSLNKSLIQTNYPLEDFIVFDLDMGKGRPTACIVRTYLEELCETLQELSIKYLYVCSAEYFKALTGAKKTSYGEVLDSLEKWGTFKVVLGVDYTTFFYDPKNKDKALRSVRALLDQKQGIYAPTGEDVLTHASYPKTSEEIKQELLGLLNKPLLACDIEARSLVFFKAGIESIGFAWSKTEGTSFCVDRHSDAKLIRHYLKEFFQAYKGTLLFHNANYDVKVLVHELWMANTEDYEGMVTGISYFEGRTEDTMILAYLSTNSTAGNQLGLKDTAEEYLGNWGENVKDLSLIPTHRLLTYNLKDCVATMYVYDKYKGDITSTNQQYIYSMLTEHIFTLIEVEINGMPINKSRVLEVKEELENIYNSAYSYITEHVAVKQYLEERRKVLVEKANAKLKKLRKTVADFSEVEFNPNSGLQVSELLYGILKLPVLSTTHSGLPATGVGVLDKLKNYADEEVVKLLDAIITLSKANKILTAFIPHFTNARPSISCKDTAYLHGNFRIGGTISGRLSCSAPNLQQLPSGSTFSKLIKSCFIPQKGWIFSGADFNALEARVDALLTKDPNKLKVYVDGYDSHSLNAYAYFKEQMPDIRQIESGEAYRLVSDKGEVFVLPDDIVVLEDGSECFVRDLIKPPSVVM